MMKLRDLFSDDATIDPQAEAIVVSGLAVDSRAVKPGDVFFALAGSKTDGARFIDAAIASGAVAVVGRPSAARRIGRAVRRARPIRAARWRWPRRNSFPGSRKPSRPSPAPAARPRSPPSRGRSGSGSVTPSASIGTIGLVSPKRTIYGSLTTPDPIALHRQLDEIAGEGVTHLAFEASSHGLDQYRLDGVRIAAGGFTNLSRDHMDYHPDVAHYLAAKLRLFRDLVDGGRRGGDLGRS